MARKDLRANRPALPHGKARKAGHMADTNHEYMDVKLSLIVPNAANIRRRFDRIDELADSIRANGNQLVQPMFVVRDGNRYMLVDGERRYRALKKVFKDDPNHLVPVRVFDDYNDARQVVVMIATNEKQTLSEDEVNAGFQLAMKLDVPTEDIELLSGLDGQKVKAARQAITRHPKVLDAPQLSLDTLASIVENDLTDKEIEKVMKADVPSQAIWRILDKRKRDAAVSEMRELAEGRGIAFEKRTGYETPEGYRYGRQSVKADTVLDVIEEAGYKPEDVLITHDGNGVSTVWYPQPEQMTDDLEAYDEKVRNLDRLRDNNAHTCMAILENMAEETNRGASPVALTHLAPMIKEHRGRLGETIYQSMVADFIEYAGEGAFETIAREYENRFPSESECIGFLLNSMGLRMGYGFDYNHSVNIYATEIRKAMAISDVAKKMGVIALAEHSEMKAIANLLLADEEDSADDEDDDDIFGEGLDE